MTKKSIAAIIFTALISFSSFSQDNGQSAFLEGCVAYSQGDWNSSVFLLKKAVAYPESASADAYYMLITAELNSENEADALDDCNTFLLNYPDSSYSPRVQYTKGKILYSLGEYEKAIIALSDFCHQYPKDDMYSYALFYIGESFYAVYKYEDAAEIYARIVSDYPDSEKCVAAQYRIESISQRSREEKLLYLLKQTGEEYLSAKEDYEKQIRMYNSDTIATTRKKLQDSQKKNEELENQINDLESQIASLRAEMEKTNATLAATQLEKEQILLEKNQAEANVKTVVVEVPVEKKSSAEEDETEIKKEKVNSEYDSDIELLKYKAFVIQSLLDQQKEAEQ